MTTWSIAVRLLADDGTPANTGPDFGKASPFGLLVIVLLLVGTFALVWSMNRHLKKLPESFDPPPTETLDGEAVGAAKDEVAGSEPDVKPPHEPSG